MPRDSWIRRLPQWWFQPRLAPQLLPLLPLSWLFGALAACRRFLYRLGVLNSRPLPVPVIVVGNITVGGSGKTPLVLWLIERLRERGWRPGVISRGYAGGAQTVRSVLPGDDPALCGDEPLLIKRRCGVPVVTGRDRLAAAEALLAAHPGCNILISDDGLQHYRLARRCEIAVFDGRGAGNGRLLPAGPLREPLTRLRRVTAVVCNGGLLPALRSDAPQFAMRLTPGRWYALDDPQRTCLTDDLRGRPLHAVAGIGDPARFFAQLSALGLQFTAYPFPDHHAYTASDFPFAANGVLLMTEKDAVKCRPLKIPEAWVLPVEAHVDASPGGRLLLDALMEKLDGRSSA